MGPTVSIKALRAPVFAASVRTSVPPPVLAAELGISPQLVTDADARISHSVMTRAWDTLAARSQDPHLGLFAASLLDAAPIDLVDLALSRAADLGGMIEGFLRYQRLFHDANTSYRRADGDRVVLVLQLAADTPRNRHVTEFVLGTWVRKGKRALGARFALTEIRLVDPEPSSVEPFVRVFGGATLRFGATDDAVVLPSSVLSEPLTEADSATWTALARQLDEVLAQRSPTTAFLGDARRALQAELLQGRTEAESLARALALSTRSLQRRLGEHGTTFSELLDEVRRDLALAHIERPDTSVTDVAFLIGFADVSSFGRAFRRWTGASPAEYRKRRAS